RESGGGVGEHDLESVAAEGTVRDSAQERREVAAVSVTQQGGATTPSGRRLRKERDRLRLVVGRVWHRRSEPRGHRGVRPEVGSPVDDLRRRAREIDRERDPTASQVGQLGHSEPPFLTGAKRTSRMVPPSVSRASCGIASSVTSASTSLSFAIVLMPTVPHLVWSASTTTLRAVATKARFVSASSRFGVVNPAFASTPCTPRKSTSR